MTDSLPPPDLGKIHYKADNITSSAMHTSGTGRFNANDVDYNRNFAQVGTRKLPGAARWLMPGERWLLQNQSKGQLPVMYSPLNQEP